MANEGIRFAQSAIDRFIQFKMIQLRERREVERNRRFDLSLQQNRRFNQERIDIAKETNRIRATQPRTTSVTVFTPGQISGTSKTQGVDDVIAEELNNIPVDKSGRSFFKLAGSETDRIKASDIEAAKQNAMSRLGIQHLGIGKNEQFDFLFNSQLEALKNPESGRTIEIIGQQRDFPSRQGDETAGFPTERTNVKHPDGRVGNIPRTQLEDAISQGFREQ